MAAEEMLNQYFEKANARLGNHEWLVGDAFTLADITWVTVHFTLFGASYDFGRYPAVQAWADRIKQRDSFQKGVLKWCPVF